MRVARPFGILPALVAGGLLLLPTSSFPADGLQPGADLRRMVEEDWSRQEQRWSRAPESAAAIHPAVARVAGLLQQSKGMTEPALWLARKKALEVLQHSTNRLGEIEVEDRLALYRRARWLARELVLGNSGITETPLLFMKRNRFICQMLHEYMGYFYDYGNVTPGGGVFVLEQPGVSLATRDLIGDRLRNGNFTTLSSSADARTVFFAFAERAE